MKVDKDALAVYAVIGGLIVCSPFIGIYEVGKWLYKHAPWELKKKRSWTKKFINWRRSWGLSKNFLLFLIMIHTITNETVAEKSIGKP